MKKEIIPIVEVDRPVNTNNAKLHSTSVVMSQEKNRIAAEENQIEAFPTKKIKTD